MTEKDLFGFGWRAKDYDLVADRHKDVITDEAASHASLQYFIVLVNILGNYVLILIFSIYCMLI